MRRATEVVPWLGWVAAGPAARAVPAFGDGSANDTWDVRQGTVVTSHSSTAGGSLIDDLFGAANSGVEREAIEAIVRAWIRER